MQIQSTDYTQTINSQYSSNSKQEKSVATTSSSSGDKISISQEAKEKAQKMNSEKVKENLTVTSDQEQDWIFDYFPPCMELDIKLGAPTSSIQMGRDQFYSEHKKEILDYQEIMFDAVRQAHEKFDSKKHADDANYSQSDIENDFRNILAENPRAKELMEILNVPKRL